VPVERTRWYAATREAVWARINDPAIFHDWTGPAGAVIDEIEPDALLVYTRVGEEGDPLSQVAIRLEPEGPGTRVTVVERALEPAPTIPIGFRARASVDA
jgi:uncharacterized protein YndB with AHSA1/START domain